MSPREHLPAIDVAKGIAILAVVMVHSELLVPSALHTHGLNRTVPVFFVLFGITSTLWWEQAPSADRLATWYRSRFTRLLPSYWAAVALWWGGQRLLSSRPLGLEPLASSLAGYAPWIQTSWFVAAILQVILVFPLLRLACERLGATTVLVSALAVLIAAQSYALGLNAWLHAVLPHPEATLGFYPFWIFVPHYFWLVLCGTQLTSWARAPSAALLLAALVVFVAAGVLEPFITSPSALLRITASVADPARTVLLLAASTLLARSDPLRDTLAWLGKNSWEIYLGQMVVHSLAYNAWERAGGPLEHRVEYTLLLLWGGVAFALAVAEVRRRIRVMF